MLQFDNISFNASLLFTHFTYSTLLIDGRQVALHTLSSIKLVSHQVSAAFLLLSDFNCYPVPQLFILMLAIRLTECLGKWFWSIYLFNISSKFPMTITCLSHVWVFVWMNMYLFLMKTMAEILSCVNVKIRFMCLSVA